MKKFLSAGGLVFACHLLTTKVAYAGWENSLAQENAQVQSIFSDCVRWLIWQVLMICYRCSLFFENALSLVFQATPNFLNDSKIQSMMNDMFKLGWAFVTVILIYIGLKQVTKSGLGLCKQALINFSIIAVVLGSLSIPISNDKTLIPLLADLSQNAIGLFMGTDGTELGLSKQLILDNLVDVKVAYDKGVAHELGNSFNPEYLDYNEQLAASDVDGKFPVYDQATGTWKTKEITTGLWGWFDTNVYRWNIQDPFILMLQFIVMSLGFIFASLKFLRLMLELAFKQVLLPFVGLTDIETGQRFKRLLTSVAMTCLMMVIVIIVFRIYQIGNYWISDNFGLNVTELNDGTLGYLRFLGYLANTLLLLDGPKIVEELFGMDAGISGDAVRTGSHVMNIGRGTVNGVKSVTKGISNAKDFVKDEKKGQWTKAQAKKVANGVQWTGKQLKNGASEVAHFKGFDEDGNVMSSNPKHDLNDSSSAQNRQSLAEMGQHAWSGTRAMVGRVNHKAQEVGFNAKMRLQDSERVQGAVNQAKDWGQNAKQMGKQAVNTHLDHLQSKAQQLQVMNQMQNDKLASERQQLADKRQLRAEDLAQETPTPKSWEEMTRSEQFESKWSHSTPASSGKSSESRQSEMDSNLTWQESLQKQLIESGNGHLVSGHVHQEKKRALQQHLRSSNQPVTNEQRMERVKQKRSKADQRAYRQMKREEREW